MKASYYVLLCSIAMLAGCVNKQIVKPSTPEITALHVQNSCLSSKNSTDRNYYYIGITSACAAYTPSATLGSERVIPVKKSQVSKYEYTKDGLVVTVLPGNNAVSAICPADECISINVGNYVCVCDKASASFLTKEDMAAGNIQYTSCMCPAEVDKKIKEAQEKTKTNSKVIRKVIGKVRGQPK